MKKKINASSSSKDQPLKLERVLGLTTSHRSSLCGNKFDVFYASGCISIKYNIHEKKQKSYYQSSIRPITCLTITESGRYIAVGERGHQPTITIWDTERKEKLTSFNNHKHGVSCLVFSPNGKYLVSVGFKHDRQLIIYEWENDKTVAVLKLSNKVNSISFHPTNRYFITCGDRHLKWWFMNFDNTGEIVDVIGKPASITEDQRNAIFTDVICGTGLYESHVYCVTSTGLLCSFLESTRMMDKVIQIESTTAYSIALLQTSISGTSTDAIAIGCSDGLIKLYTNEIFDYLVTFPLPSALSTVNDIITYPACYAIHAISTDNFSYLIAVYSDHSLYAWDISDISQISLHHCDMSHRGCIWDIQFIESTNNKQLEIPSNSFITCSSDHTIKLWNLSDNLLSNRYSKDILKSIEIPLVNDGQSTSTPSTIVSNGSLTITSQSKHSIDLSNGLPDYELPSYSSYDSSTPRAITVNMSLGHIVIGDRSGYIHIYDLNSSQRILYIQAHSAEILTLHFSPTLYNNIDGNWTIDDQVDEIYGKEMIMLASAGRDRLIHIYNCADNYSLIDTLDYHSSSITNVRFTLDGTKLISCGGDRTLVISLVNGPTISKFKSILTPHGTINGLALETTNKFVITSGQDKRMNIWNLNSGKHMRVYKNDLITSELYKCDIDPSGMYVSACAFDKSISLLDFFSGDVIAQVTGHSELITGIRFSPDGRWLISTGGDGCMLVWKISDILVKTMQERLVELYTTAQNKQNKVILKQTEHLSNVIVDQPNIPSNSRESINPNKNNRWKSRVVESGGNYEIFGRKVSVDKINDLNKFSTLDLTSTVAPVTNVKVDNDHPNQSLANTIEELDSVIMSGLSDDDSDDGSKLFPNLPIPSPDKAINSNPTNTNNESEYWDDFDEDNSHIIESVNKVDVLEKSASNLENWLENMLRNEGTLDETISNKPIDTVTSTSNQAISSKNDLNKSLSSTFFNNLRNVKPTDRVDPIDNKAKVKSEDKVTGNALEGKRRETAAAVAQMKEKLRAMGILGSSIVKTNISNQTNIDSSTNTSNNNPSDVMTSPLPPPPVYKACEISLNDDNDMLYPPAPPIQEIKSNDLIICDESNDINETQSKLKSLADTCRQSLRELEVAKEKALDNIKQYLSLQTSLDQSVFSPVNKSNQSLDIRQSISIETESLLVDFRRSIESMNELSQPLVNQSNSFSRHLSSTSLDSTNQLSISSLELNHILEKYSNQLVDLVSDKIVKKIQRQI